ncbi:E3 ubiquitin-protein ligase RMA3 [Citrus sinensis]|nr:E3 ubiquitin-protein ligase RMA3 [Citrus sinensis]
MVQRWYRATVAPSRWILKNRSIQVDPTAKSNGDTVSPLHQSKGILVVVATCANKFMAFEQYFAREWKSIASAATGSENYNGCFDCNICLDFAYDPVVTLCGHLYCWPCIYKWLHVQSASLASDEHPQCPVCKADISHTTMVPLYGRGQTPTESEPEGKVSHRGTVIPPRPPAFGNQALLYPTSNTGQQLPYRNPYQSQNYDPHGQHSYGGFEGNSPSPLLNLGGTALSGFQHPVVGNPPSIPFCIICKENKRKLINIVD